jgi:hypothetical protein
MRAAGEQSEVAFRGLDIIQAYSTDGIVILFLFLVFQLTAFSVAT